MVNKTKRVRSLARNGAALPARNYSEQQSPEAKGLQKPAAHLPMQTDTLYPHVVRGADQNAVGAATARGPPSERVLLTPADIKRIYGISESTQAKGRMTGDTWPFIKRGRSVLAFRDSVEDWFRSKMRRSTSDTGRIAA